MTQVGAELNQFFIDRLRILTQKEPTTEQVSILGHLKIAYGIIEEVHALYKKK
jgi:hypothetical protein